MSNNRLCVWNVSDSLYLWKAVERFLIYEMKAFKVVL